MFKYSKLTKKSMAYWLQSTFSSDKFNERKALRHTRRENQIPKYDRDFEEIFLELAKEDIIRKGRALYVNEVDRLTQRARIMARHKRRDFGEPKQLQPKQELLASDSEAYVKAQLPSEFATRLLKQLKSIKETTNPLLNEGEFGDIRNWKMKTAADNIQKIILEMNDRLKSKSTTPELERTLKSEMIRWNEFVKTIHSRLNRKMGALDFRDYVSGIEKSFKSS
jgi:hypothetical protein